MGSFAPPASFSIDRKLLRTAMETPLLDADREIALARAWRERQDGAALQELTSAYLRLVISLATRFRTYGLPLGDLVQEGTIGLMQAAARFEPDRQVRFSTYASWWIRSAMQDYILRNWSIVRTGTTAAQKSLFFNLRRLRALIREGGAERLTAEGRASIAKKLRVDVREVEKMEARLASADRSLNAAVGEDGDGEWQDLIADDRPDPENTVIEARVDETRRSWLDRALKRLSSRELTIIRERRLSEDGETLEALGARLGISKERVRQIEQVALKKLKSALLAEHKDPVGAGLINA